MDRLGSVSDSLNAYSTFGQMLKALRRQARLTQRDLGIAVGYSETYITRLEGDSRQPDIGAVRGLFIEALGLEHQPELARRLVELAQVKHSKSPQKHDVLSASLPVQLTRFIGRKHETAEVQRLLENTRLLMLTGPGGTGKTRLALEIGSSFVGASSRFVDGVWLAEFAPVTHSALVAETVATAIGLHPANRPAMALLVEYLHERKALLIIDNCEHLIQACAELADTLLRTCPHLHILATSRESLNITGETTWRVPPLSTDEAVQLFVDRANEISPGYTPTDQNAVAIAQICNRLDGIPLAIELAAARLRAFSLQQIAARLDDRFHLLTGGSRTALPRHQTLRMMIDWSYNLLSDEERNLLRQLAVFAGGWTLEAAEKLCGDPDTAKRLAQLVNKSLVGLDETKTGVRYRMLETIRQYAHEKLEKAGEYGQTRQRHMEVLTDLAQTAGPHLGGPMQVYWLDQLDSELDNLRTALAWVASHQDIQAAERLISGIWWFWFLRAYLSEGIRWISEIMLAEHVVDPAVWVKANAWLGWLGIHKGDIANSKIWFEAASVHVRSQGDAHLLHLVLCGQAPLMPEFGEATRLLDEALAIATLAGWPREQAQAMWILGALMRRQGDPQRANQLLTQGLALARQAGDRYFCAQILLKLGLRALDRVDYPSARALLEESVALVRELGAEVGIADSLIELGTLGVRQCDFDLARTAIKECITAYSRAGNIQRLAQCISMSASIADTLGQVEQAVHLLAAVAAARANLPRRLEFNSTMYEEYDRLLPVVRSKLSPAAFEGAWIVGGGMTLNQALQLAMAV